MPKPLPTYTRLTRRTASISSYQSLWLAADHLLILTSTGYTEEYQRLRLRDIKGFFVVTSARRIYWSLPWGIFAVIGGSIMIYEFSIHETPVISTIVSVGSLLALGWNHLLGQGCHAYVVTGVQTALLPSLVRRPKTRQVLGRLESLILAAQADLAPSVAVTPDAIAGGASPLPS